MSVAKDITGQRFGRLTVISRAPRGRLKSHQAMWLCKCDCGNETVTSGSRLRAGTTQSCSCLKFERISAAKTTHGGSAHSKGKTRVPGRPLYKLWAGIKRRCNSPTERCYYLYGGRGIKVHGPWVNDFASFEAYIMSTIGPRPPGMSLDRIDNDRGYEPGNLRWATPIQQAENRGHVTKLVARIHELEARLAELETEADRHRAENQRLRKLVCDHLSQETEALDASKGEGEPL